MLSIFSLLPRAFPIYSVRSTSCRCCFMFIQVFHARVFPIHPLRSTSAPRRRHRWSGWRSRRPSRRPISGSGPPSSSPGPTTTTHSIIHIVLLVTLNPNSHLYPFCWSHRVCIDVPHLMSDLRRGPQSSYFLAVEFSGQMNTEERPIFLFSWFLYIQYYFFRTI